MLETSIASPSHLVLLDSSLSMARQNVEPVYGMEFWRSDVSQNQSPDHVVGQYYDPSKTAMGSERTIWVAQSTSKTGDCN